MSERHFDLANLLAPQQFVDDGEIVADGMLGILDGFGLRRALRPATRQAWNGYGEAFFGLMEGNSVVHGFFPTTAPRIAGVHPNAKDTPCRRTPQTEL